MKIVARLPHQRRGSSLIAVFWLMSILSLAVFTAVRLLYYEVDLAANQVHGTKARHLAEMGIAIGTNQVVERDEPMLYQEFDGGIEGFDVTITSEGSRFNINALLAPRPDTGQVDKAFLRELFASWGLEPELSEELVDALVDWVDEGELEENKGAERQTYEAMGFINRPFDRPFYSLDEMRQVRGMDELEYLYPDWRRWFTIWSSGGLDVNEADPELIAAAAEVNIDEAESVQDRVVGLDGIRGTEDDSPFNSSTEVMDYLGVPDAQRALVEPRLTANDPTSRIESVGWSGDIRRKIILIVRNRNSGRPSILERKEELIP